MIEAWTNFVTMIVVAWAFFYVMRSTKKSILMIRGRKGPVSVWIVTCKSCTETYSIANMALCYCPMCGVRVEFLKEEEKEDEMENESANVLPVAGAGTTTPIQPHRAVRAGNRFSPDADSD